jgi:hypothetical protein
VVENSVGVWSENEIAWSDGFRSIVGLRADWFRFDVDDQRELNSGERDDAIVSPKLPLVFGPGVRRSSTSRAASGFTATTRAA